MAQHVRGFFDLRQELISNGVLALQGGLYQFTQDYSFSAPSTAAAVVLGRSANGRIEWKAADGRTLKEIQEAEAGQVLSCIIPSRQNTMISLIEQYRPEVAALCNRFGVQSLDVFGSAADGAFDVTRSGPSIF